LNGEIVDLAGARRKVVGKIEIDVNRRGAGVPLRANLSCDTAAVPVVVRLPSFEVTWALKSATMEMPSLGSTAPAATGSKCLISSAAWKGVSDVSFCATGPAVPFRLSEPPPATLSESSTGNDWVNDKFFTVRSTSVQEKGRPAAGVEERAALPFSIFSSFTVSDGVALVCCDAGSAPLLPSEEKFHVPFAGVNELNRW